MKIQITPVQIFPHTATQIEFLPAEVTLGVYSMAIRDAMLAGIASVITESNRCEDLIDAEETTTPSWPAL